MNCPEVQELFSDYLDGRSALSQASLVKEHLGTCTACRQELEDLRQTIELLGSVEVIEASPDFLAQVNRKIDRSSGMSRLWRWSFTPAKIKIPLEVAALATVAVLAVYLYRSSKLPQESLLVTKKSPEQSEEASRRAENDPGGQAQDSRMILAYKESDRKEAPPPVSEALPGKETPAPLAEAPGQRPAQSPPELAAGTAEKDESSGASEARAGRGALPAAPGAGAPGSADRTAKASPQVLEVESEDLGLFQRRVRDMLANLTGRVVSEQASEEGLLLAVEVPQSREEEFRNALKKEAGTGLSRMAAKKGQSAKAAEEQRARSPVPAAQRAMRSEEKLSAAKEEPAVAIEIRVWAKK